MNARTRKTLAAGSALALGGVAVALAMGPAGAAPQTETFEYTGAPETFVVPAGVCEVTVDAYGAEGGAEGDIEGGGGAAPGLGGRATATIPVEPGETLIVRVGGQGGEPDFIDVSPGESEPEGGNVGGAGGYNGGAPGGEPGGSGGGGASDVRQGGDALTNRVVVAGGGGGVGEDSDDTSGGGGDGGGAEGTEGQPSSGGSDGGDGGTQSGGGAGGTTDPTAGDGTLGEGGIGGSGANDDEGGGGGGGGYYGGGGGAGDADQDKSPPAAQGEAGTEGAPPEDAGGGGGGSGFGPAGVSFETGVQSGNGQVTITYDPAAGGCEPDVLPDDDLPDVIEATPPFTG